MKVKDYGDFISQVLGKELICYECFGSYQGEWIAVLKQDEQLEFWKGSYGSCSVCDFLKNCESSDDYEYHIVPDDEAMKYFNEEKPFITIPINVFKNCTLDDFITLMPRNIGEIIYEFEPEKLFNELRLKLKA